MENSEISEGSTSSYGISIDLLKNTPSNIARLEDAIDQCKGRQKYIAQTKSPSDGEDVRWYFCKVPLAENELSASVPRTEVVGKGEYFRFSTRDSLALEASFLNREEDLLSLWWKEYAECSEGPSVRNVSAVPTLESQPQSSSSGGNQLTAIYADEEERVGVPVKGGLYEVDLAKRHCFPVYWNGENRRVLRGHWFARKGSLDWLPLRDDVAEQLEFAYHSQVWHRRTFQPSGLFAARVDMQGSLPGLHALFTGEDDTWEAWLNFSASGFSSVINLRGNSIKLRRGYSLSGSPKPSQDELRQQKEEEMDDYCSQVPVRQLVFMVHGIGQRSEKANLVDDVGNFRQVTASVAAMHLTSYQRDTQRVLFIPCQWRKGLKLGGESAVDKITLDGVRGLRVMLSATAHDILYYMSPIYCQDIMNSVSNQLNRLYKKFLMRNPGYDGKVSIYAHSLGSVLSYDILCHQDDLSSPIPMECMSKETLKEEQSQPHQSLESSLVRSLVNLESTSNPTNDLETKFDVEEKEDQSCSAHDSAPVDVQKASYWTYPENGPDLCQQTVESQQSSDLSIDDVREQGSNYTLSLDETHFDSTSSKASEVYNGEVDMQQDNISDNTIDKEILIKLLTEEVDSLKTRITDLELQCRDEDKSREKHQADKDIDANNQYISQNPQEEVISAKNYKPHIKYTKLEFQVDTFFAVGSPLGVFLSLRNVRMGIGKGKSYWQDESIIEEMPACRQMFNIFHPFDPVAFRVEPLVCKEYVNKRPVIIPYHRGGKRLHIGFQEITEDLASRSHAVVSHINTLKVKVLTACQSRNNDNIDEGTESSSEIEERSYGSIMMERLTGSREGRIDHVLQDKTFEHQYISAIHSHTNYWRDRDTALFILRHLYRDIPEEPDSPLDFEENNSNKHPVPKGRFFQSDTVDDDDLLTFSSRIAVKEFSWKVRKAMKKNS